MSLLCLPGAYGEPDPALIRAVERNDLAQVQRLATPRARLDDPGRTGYTPLQEAIRWGHREIALLLLQRGAGTEALDADGHTALHHAAAGNEQEILRALLAAGAVVDGAGPFHYTPLHFAAREGHLEAARLLLAAGADINARIDVGFTAVDLAEDYPELQEFLRAQGGKSFAQLRR